MSFLLDTFEVPLWFLAFAFGCAAPLWIKWYKAFYKKFIATGLLQKKFRKESGAAVDKMDVLKKATDNWNASVEHELRTAESKKSRRKNTTGSSEQPYVKIVLKTLALNGDAGMLIQSIADNLNIKSNEIKSSLAYLEKNGFVEAVVGGSMGTKYYLDDRGKKYCVKRGYISQ